MTAKHELPGLVGRTLIGALLLFGTGWHGAYQARAQDEQAVGDRSACLVRVTREFTVLIDDIVYRSVNDRSSGNYAGAQNPKAFALCIDWDRSTSRSRFGSGWGFASGGSLVDNRALEWCGLSSGATAGTCQCEVVHRNGYAAIRFPPGWLERQCK